MQQLIIVIPSLLEEESPIIKKYNAFCREYFPFDYEDGRCYYYTTAFTTDGKGVFEKITATRDNLVKAFGEDVISDCFLMADQQHPGFGKEEVFFGTLYSYCILEYFKSGGLKIFNYATNSGREDNPVFRKNMDAIVQIIRATDHDVILKSFGEVNKSIYLPPAHFGITEENFPVDPITDSTLVDIINCKRHALALRVSRVHPVRLIETLVRWGRAPDVDYLFAENPDFLSQALNVNYSKIRDGEYFFRNIIDRHLLISDKDFKNHVKKVKKNLITPEARERICVRIKTELEYNRSCQESAAFYLAYFKG